MWLCTMQISVNMAFHLLLMHCYTATHWKETVTTGKTDDPLAYFSICIGSIASAETSAKINPFKRKMQRFFFPQQECSWMLRPVLQAVELPLSVFNGHIPATRRVLSLGSSAVSFWIKRKKSAVPATAKPWALVAHNIVRGWGMLMCFAAPSPRSHLWSLLSFGPTEL